MTFRERAAKDFRGPARRDLPVPFRIGSKQYENGAFNPGSLSYSAVPGGLLEDYGGPTLMYATADLPALGAFEYVTVGFPIGKWTRYEVLDRYPGQAVTTLTLTTPEKP